MPMIVLILLALSVPLSALGQDTVVHITTSCAVDYARAIAHDEGYDVTRTGVYTFDLLTKPDGKPIVDGYITFGFDINANARNMIGISERTGQAIDYDTCEVFDYPDLRPFQDGLQQLTKAKRMTADELASDVGCMEPQVLTKPVPIAVNP